MSEKSPFKGESMECPKWVRSMGEKGPLDKVWRPGCDPEPFKKGGSVKKGLFSADLEKGGLHRALGVPEGKKIGMKKIEKAEHSRSPHVRKMAQWAENAAMSRKK